MRGRQIEAVSVPVVATDGDVLGSYEPLEGRRISTGIDSLDTIFGRNTQNADAGIHLPSITLWAGVAGLGKTALMLEVLANILRRGGVKCALVSAEQDGRKIRADVVRLGLDDVLSKKLTVIVTDDFDEMLARLRDKEIEFAVIDSISELTRKNDNPNDEFNNQDRMMKILMSEVSAGGRHRAFVIVSHVNAEDRVAGRRKTQHKVDTIITLSGNRNQICVECEGKNRNGASGVRAFFRMDDRGKVVEIPATPIPPRVESGALVPVATEPVAPEPTTVVAPAVDIAVTIDAPLTPPEPELDVFEAPQVPIADLAFEGLLARGDKRRKEALAKTGG